MELVFFIYGLAFFILGVAVALETRRHSGLVLQRHLPWLAAFGFIHSAVEWIDMFLLIESAGPATDPLLIARTILLPVSALCLVRFGAGMVSEAGPLPDWLTLIPPALMTPVTLVVAYALILIATKPPWTTAADVWSRYLLYLPGCVLTGLGFLRQRRHLDKSGLASARGLLLGAAVAFLVNAFAAGLVVPKAPYGLAPWLNYDSMIAAIGVPAQVWRALAAIAVTLFVLRALDVFEAERQQQMAALRDARERAQTKARAAAELWVEASVKITRKIAALESIEGILSAVVEHARGLSVADGAALALWDENYQKLMLRAVASEAGIETGGARTVQRGIIVEAAQEGQSRRIPEADGQSIDPWFCPVLEAEVRAAAIVPLRLDKVSLGALWVTRVDARAFHTADLASLEHLADQAVIAIEHAILTGKLQSLAVMEERERIAREMHDSISQILGYLGIEMQTLEALVKAGDQGKVLQHLTLARKRISDAYVDVRENILSLRTTLSGNRDLVSALGEYVGEFGCFGDTEVDLVIDVPDPLPLSPLAEVQLIRIVQEALTNVRKHARACHAEVRLEVENGWVRASVYDDGVGMDCKMENGHFGLRMMRERAESVDGALSIDSTRGSGTQVTIRLPILQRR